MTPDNAHITLADGGGGRQTDQLLGDLILKYLPHQPILLDAATVELADGIAAFTTDSYTVSPIFFPGGDIGTLAVRGTCNDLAMAGARPVALSLALIIEEGLPVETLQRVLQSVGRTCGELDVKVVTGDTKVVPRGQADGIYINTAGIGRISPNADLGFERIRTGDKILLTGTIGDHGLAVMARREGLSFDTPIVSDVAALTNLAGQLVDELASAIKFMRDPTRAGVAGVLADITENTNKQVMVYEDRIPVNPATRSAAEVLGLDVLTVANEGKLIAVIDPNCAGKALAICRRFEYAAAASIIGEVNAAGSGRAVLTTAVGGRRIIQKPHGEQLPRIC